MLNKLNFLKDFSFDPIALLPGLASAIGTLGLLITIQLV